MPKLENARHERFAQEYSLDANATRSYAVAYKRGNDTTSRQNGNKLLNNTKVQQRVKELTDKIAIKHGVTVQECIEAWERLANFNVADIMEYDGVHAYIKNLKDLPREVTDAIKSIKTVTRGEGDGAQLITEVTFWDKTKARDALTRIAGAYNDKVTVESKSIEEHIKELGD